ncbi:MAG: hemolysin family protein [Verrucomicrobiales bacterium]
MALTLLIFYLLLAIGISFLCSVLEAVLLSITQPWIQNQKREGAKSGLTWERLKSDVNAPLSAILILNTIAHTVGAAGVGSQAEIVFQSVPFAVISGVLTILILVLSEIIPKTLGATYWRQIASPAGWLLTWLTRLLTPLVWISNKITSIFGKGHGIGGVSREEFAAMAEIGHETGALDAEERRIVQNLLKMRQMPVKSIMTPRTVVFSMPRDRTVADFLAASADKPFSRIPIFADTRDNLVGFVLKRDVLLAAAQGEGEKILAAFGRELPSVPEAGNIWNLFQDIAKDREHIRAVRDEYGGVSGIVTLEDVVESLLGTEIMDEADENADMQQVARELWARRAKRMGISLGRPPPPSRIPPKCPSQTDSSGRHSFAQQRGTPPATGSGSGIGFAPGAARRDRAAFPCPGGRPAPRLRALCYRACFHPSPSSRCLSAPPLPPPTSRTFCLSPSTTRTTGSARSAGTRRRRRRTSMPWQSAAPPF